MVENKKQRIADLSPGTVFKYGFDVYIRTGYEIEYQGDNSGEAHVLRLSNKIGNPYWCTFLHENYIVEIIGHLGPDGVMVLADD